MIKTFALGWALYIFWIYAQIYCAMNPALAQNQSQRGMAQRYHLRDCMVELSTITDPDLRRWCEIQSKRMP